MSQHEAESSQKEEMEGGKSTATFWSPDMVLQKLLMARRKEEQDLKENVACDSKLISIEQLKKASNPALLLHGDQGKAFTERQSRVLDGVLEYVFSGQQWNSGRDKPSQVLTDLLEELRDWDSSSCAFEFASADEIVGDHAGVRLAGPVECYIEAKYDALSRLYAHNITNSFGGFLTEEMEPQINIQMYPFERSKLELLMRLFEDGASKYPGLAHSVMSWPLLRFMPRPPKHIFPDFEFPKQRERGYYATFLHPCPMVTAKTETWSCYGNTSEAGGGRFRALALEAGEIAARALFGSERPLGICLVVEKKIFSRDLLGVGIDFWLQAIHLMRGTLKNNDGWDGLFDGDSDYGEKGLEEGLYRFWRSEDVFLDSALLCNEILSRGEAKEEAGSGDESLPVGLTDTERNLLEALGGKTLRGEELLNTAGYDYSSHGRNILSNLVKREILDPTRYGYRRRDARQ